MSQHHGKDNERELTPGGSFLLRPVSPEEVFTLEDCDEEHQMIARTARDFMEETVMPHVEAIEEEADDQLVARLMRQAGEVGLLGHYLPEKYGGSELDKISSALINEQTGRTGAYGIAHVNHTGIATLPIYYFGTEEQKRKYLPGLATGKLIGAYCLTEPTGGSDSLAARTTAVLNAAGTHYVLNGTKQFITNAAFSDTFIVYAKVDGQHFTAFIVEKDFPGLRLGPEERKMGMHGSSTRQVILEDCQVPVENLLGEVGKGHQIAFNVLNIGRFNVGIGCLGAAKEAFGEAARYAVQRRQFGQPLAAFGAIQEKLADMAARIFALESLQYRTAALLEAAFAPIGRTGGNISAEFVRRSQAYALECSICKVFGSESLDRVVDEAVQIHGGYGYIREYPVERMYRNSRINRIWEGTNEINRMIIPGMLLRMAKAGQLPLEEAIGRALSQDPRLDLVPKVSPDVSHALGEMPDWLDEMKLSFLRCIGLAWRRIGERLQQEQEVAMRLADMAIWIYAAESSILRAAKTVAKQGEETGALQVSLASLVAHEAVAEVERAARYILDTLMEEGTAETDVKKWRQALSAVSYKGVREQKRLIAEKMVEAGRYQC
ncbi:MAG: acyl-CoA dehydrogenase [Bacillus thermozeamaize]|uniref:Acyl-CoA dehydrogenase n=1 Tax=Bacillus thermozeamaize TaxID=230954 RepID=A0A1Y3PMG1_9BACI|nr:MAG: acyl-CoA dehydrogenase [Bacillus thermozeamaize]